MTRYQVDVLDVNRREGWAYVAIAREEADRGDWDAWANRTMRLSFVEHILDRTLPEGSQEPILSFVAEIPWSET